MRRLPVIQDSTTEDAVAAARPRWQWVLVGAGLIVTIFAPLVLLVLPLGGAIPPVVAFGSAAVAAGSLVGRFGGKSGPSDAAFAGCLAAALLSLLVVVGGGALPGAVAAATFLVLSVVGASAAYGGGVVGARRKAVLDSRR